MMQSYKQFATIYDALMTADIPYDDYVHIIETAVGSIAGKKILDVGCGTGILSLKLAQLDAQVTGVDLSAEMLMIARERAEAFHQQIEFIEMPMQQLEGLENYDLAVISIDSLNYVIDEKDVQDTFHHLNAALKRGGRLIFDVHSTFKTDVIFMESPFIYDDEDISYIWLTDEGAFAHSVLSELSFFVKNDNGTYDRFNEQHYQRTFPLNTYVQMLEQAGFQIERIFADWQDEAPDEESERIFFQVVKK
ncbi:MAG TPA: class I SAM-dependent methyltransferase [Sporosarcina sp.]|nr:class I SAM-dependent methyltransferase [Sporosarcina sp.]